MNNRYLLFLFSFLLLPLSGFGQQAGSDRSVDEALVPVHQLFDGMRAGDSTMVRAAFDPLARLVTTFFREGKPDHRVTRIDDFVTLVGTPHEEVWDERIWDVEVDIRDNLASVWMKYAFFRGDTFSHCGVNSFEIFNTVDGWKVMHLADTHRRDDCEMPGGGSDEQ